MTNTNVAKYFNFQFCKYIYFVLYIQIYFFLCKNITNLFWGESGVYNIFINMLYTPDKKKYFDL